MALVVPAGAERDFLDYILHRAGSEDLVLRLFVNNVTPDETFTTASLVEASGGGYAPVTLNPNLWTYVGSDPTVARYPDVTFTFSGALDGNATIYGMYLTGLSTGRIKWPERAALPFQPVSAGQQFVVSLSFGGD